VGGDRGQGARLLAYKVQGSPPCRGGLIASATRGFFWASRPRGYRTKAAGGGRGGAALAGEAGAVSARTQQVGGWMALSTGAPRTQQVGGVDRTEPARTGSAFFLGGGCAALPGR
jgi:hypothetical protein